MNSNEFDFMKLIDNRHNQLIKKVESSENDEKLCWKIKIKLGMECFVFISYLNKYLSSTAMEIFYIFQNTLRKCFFVITFNNFSGFDVDCWMKTKFLLTRVGIHLRRKKK
ncbi:CLUMA_CG016670, isoform A [Clunio marinus]|uniref:CLUMA_CG016670, isoform A n=1 Tax=Clunio marinus TaxID=568069 RepID=A0A1J1IVR9_9DIPT|nr:CLUMA_CG016670, isoform A [Clunio marinus]